MSRFHGKQGKGAMRRLREIKREEAQERQAQPTPHERTKRHRKAVEATAHCPECEA
jgi:hypothetical protein